VGGTVLSLLVHPDTIRYALNVSFLQQNLLLSVGASGALYGLLGAWFCEIICKQKNERRRLNAITGTWNKTDEVTRVIYLIQSCMLFTLSTLNYRLVLYIVIGMVISVVVGLIDWAGHLGGLIVGMLLATFFFSEHLQDERKRNLLPQLAKGCTIILIASGILAFYLFIPVDSSPRHLQAVGLSSSLIKE
jgi:membrane associated rhomboid family serine protease